MNDSFGVGRIERVGNLDCDIEQLLQIEWPALDHIPQSLAFQILHHQEDTALVLANFVNCANVRMIQSGRGTSLPPESFQRLRIIRQGVGEKLESDKTVELDVLSLVDHTHPTASELAQDTIVRDCVPNNRMEIRHLHTC